MHRCKAKIIGFKRSKKRAGCYYPVFEYVDAYGEKRRHTRSKCIEKTPFTMQKKYVVYDGVYEAYERSEMQLTPKTYLFLLKIWALVVALVRPMTALWMALLVIAIRVWCQLTPMLRRVKSRQLRYATRPTSGKIVGYQKSKRRGFFLISKYEYHPLIEYVYDGNKYIHVSKTTCEENAYVLHSACDIYIDQKHKMVYDELELRRPITDIDQVAQSWADLVNAIKEMPAKAAARRSIKVDKTNKTNTASNKTPKIIPLKTHEVKVSGWY